MFENFGELKVYVPDKNVEGRDIPLPKTYVKVYQKTFAGVVKFFKDGYSDLRGRFDYATLSGTSISDVEMLAIFISHDQYGSVTREVKPPAGSKKK
mmetsp:Transcript_39411/g.37887  ORF Transcript_39411/g.37887 Transcript_39411/m.37887 type:complete len:96 (+) Transcript_39411:77-364(+)